MIAGLIHVQHIRHKTDAEAAPAQPLDFDHFIDFTDDIAYPVKKGSMYRRQPHCDGRLGFPALLVPPKQTIPKLVAVPQRKITANEDRYSPHTRRDTE